MLSEEEKRKRIEYWENNKEILLIKERERYHNNIEKQRARSKKYRDENKEAISLRNKANPKRQQSYKIYYNTNKETVLSLFTAFLARKASIYANSE